MNKEEYINAITEMLKNCDADSTLKLRVFRCPLHAGL